MDNKANTVTLKLCQKYVNQIFVVFSSSKVFLMYTIDCNHNPRLWCVKYNGRPCYFASTVKYTEQQMQDLIASDAFQERMAA